MKRSHLTFAIVAALAIAAPAHSGSWPTKPLRMIVPFAAGSTTDIIPRMVAEQLSKQIGEPIVVENRAGAGGTIGTTMAARAEADGYVLLASGASHTIGPALYPNAGYNAERDFVAVVPLGMSPAVLVVSPTSPFRTVGDLIAAAKKKPGGLTYSSVGIGSATHMSAERFIASAGIEALHVPFKGGAEAMMEVVAGRCDFFFAPLGIAMSQIREGKLVPLVVNGARRASVLPNVPTTGEAGLRDAEYAIWFGFFAPAKTPRDVVDRLNLETQKALHAPGLSARLAQMGLEPMPMRPEEFDAFVREEVVLNAALVKRIGITVQ